jgi:stage V sporulation protein G
MTGERRPGMRITEVKVFPVSDNEKLKGYASIIFDDCFVVRDLKVIQGTNGLFIAMPSKKTRDGSYRDTAHPLNNETRRMIEDAVIGEYERETGTVASLDGVAAAR